MLFNSYVFLCVFLPIVFTLYYLPPFRRFQVFILIIASFVFYAYSHMEYLLLLLISACLNAIVSYYTYHSNTQRTKMLVALIGVGCNLALLIFFKYGKLIYSTFFCFSSLGEWLLTLPLPIGISFYTFQGISLLIDVMRGDPYIMEQKPANFLQHLSHVVFFISFFPHSIAGPIVKAHDFLPQIHHKILSDIPITAVCKTLILGFFFKSVIADNMQNHTFWISYPYFLGMSTIQLFFMMIGYSVQIFADFAGYSLIAIGIAALFGYRLPQNFNYPYISQSFHEFWQRWHISLSSWLKEYLYIPLGGNRHGSFRTCINLFLVMLLGGMWHGAAWNYLFWGGMHGIFLVVERLLIRGGTFINIQTSNLWQCLRITIIFLVTSWAWLFFKMPHAEYAFLYAKEIILSIMNKHFLGADNVVLCCFLYSFPIFIYHVAYFFNFSRTNIYFRQYEPFIYAFMLFCIIANGGTSDAFIYFQF